MTFDVKEVRAFNQRTRYLASDINNRRTGRTFRILLDACKNLSEGKDIIIVAHTEHYASGLKNSVGDMLRAYLSDDYISDAMRRIKTMSHRNYDIDDLRGVSVVFIRDHHHG